MDPLLASLTVPEILTLSRSEVDSFLQQHIDVAGAEPSQSCAIAMTDDAMDRTIVNKTVVKL